jgi:hypothetical protein
MTTIGGAKGKILESYENTVLLLSAFSEKIRIGKVERTTIEGSPKRKKT